MAAIVSLSVNSVNPLKGDAKGKRRGASRVITTAPLAIIIIILLFHRKVSRRIYNNNTRCIGRPRESFIVFRANSENCLLPRSLQSIEWVFTDVRQKKMSAEYLKSAGQANCQSNCKKWARIANWKSLKFAMNKQQYLDITCVLQQIPSILSPTNITTSNIEFKSPPSRPTWIEYWAVPAICISKCKFCKPFKGDAKGNGGGKSCNHHCPFKQSLSLSYCSIEK